MQFAAILLLGMSSLALAQNPVMNARDVRALLRAREVLAQENDVLMARDAFAEAEAEPAVRLTLPGGRGIVAMRGVGSEHAAQLTGRRPAA